MKIGWPRTSVGWWRLCFAVAAAAFSLAIILQPPPWRVFAEAGAKMRVVDYVVAFTWIAAAVNIVALAFLAVLCPWWARAPRPVPATGTVAQPPTPRWFWPALLPAVLACAVICGPLLSQSLWDDEEASLRFAMLGRYKREQPGGQLFFKELRWRDTLYYYNPNNHVLYSALARASNSVWRALAKPSGLQFKEWALRIPAFLAGLATLVVLALLLKDMGLPLAGVLASWFLALHPWFAKYCAEARAYTMVMLFVCLTLLFWRRALVAGRWKDWAFFAGSQALAMWSWPGALFFFVLLNLATPVLLFFGGKTAAPPSTVLSRWFCCNALAAVALLPLTLPHYPQLRGYIAGLQEMDLTSKWFADTSCYVATGAPWTKQDPGQLVHPEVKAPSEQHPWLYGGSLIAGVLLLAWGTVRLWRIVPTGATMLLATTGALALQIAQAMHGRFYIFEWYVIYLLPVFAGVFGTGLAGAVVALSKMRHGRMVSLLLTSAVVVCYLTVTQPARAWRAAHSTVPFRESVLLTRPDLDPWSVENSRILTAGVTNPAFSYDANFLWIRSPCDLATLCLQADRQLKPLWLNLGHLWTLRERQPDFLAMIEDTALFTDYQKLRGEYPHCDRMVCRYIPGSLDREKMRRYLSAEEIIEAENHAGDDPVVYFGREGRRNVPAVATP